MLKSNWEKTFVLIFTFIFCVNLTNAAVYPYNANYSRSTSGYTIMDRTQTYLNNTVDSIETDYSDKQRILIITSDSDQFGFTTTDINAVFNARIEYNETKAEFKNKLPFNAWTSVTEYFNQQSSGAFQIYATVIRIDDDLLYETRRDKEGDDFPDTSVADKIDEIIDEKYGEDFENPFDLTILLTRDSRIAATQTIFSSSSGFGLTASINYPDGDLRVRDLCYSVANAICKFPPTYHSHLAGFCLMSETLSDINQASEIKIGDHPPSINPYYKVKAGWAQEIVLDQHSKLRAGILHEGPIVYKYQPEREDERYYTRNEFFMFETRQNRGYEGGREIQGTRGIGDPDPIEPREGINPADGLIVYQIYEGNPGGTSDGVRWSANTGWYARILDSRLTTLPSQVPLRDYTNSFGQETTGQQFYASYPYEQLTLALNSDEYPWFTVTINNDIEDAGFREQQEIFVATIGAGSYDENEQPAPSGGYHHQPMNPDGTVDLNLTGEDKYFILPWPTWPAPLTDITDYNPANTLPGQFDKNGKYVPSGQYVTTGLPLVVPGVKIDPSQISLEPNGIGYYDANGNYAPGGGYAPDLDPVTGLVTYVIRRERTEADDGYAFGGTQIEPLEMGVGSARIIYDHEDKPVEDLVGRFPDEVGYTPAEDLGGSHLFTYNDNKSFISNDTAPALEFDEFFNADNGDSYKFKHEVSQPDIDKILPAISDISPPLRTVTFEVCNNSYYKGGEHGAPLGSNGYISYKYTNDLGVTAFPDLTTEGKKEYTFNVTVDYFERPRNIAVGIWNRGGQYTDYKVINSDPAIAKLSSGISEGRLTNRSETLEFQLDLVDWVRRHASELPITTRMKIAEIQWKQLLDPKIDFTVTKQADVFIDLTVKSAAQILVGADPAINNDEISVEGTAHLVGPIYAKTLRKNYYIFNHDQNDETRGGSLLRTWSIASDHTLDGKPIDFVSPSVNTDSRNTLWTGGYGITTDQIILQPKQFNQGLDDGNLIRWSEIYIYSENTDINTSDGNPDAIGQQKILVHTSITCRRPDSPNPRFLDYELTQLIEDGDVEKEDVGYQDLTSESGVSTLIFEDIEDVDLYAIYRTDNKDSDPEETHIVDFVYSSKRDGDSVLGYSVLTPGSNQTDYYWMRSVGINDQDIEDQLYNDFINGQPVNLEQLEDENPTNVFLGDFSLPSSLSRAEVYSTSDLEATTTIINRIDLTWSLETHKYRETELVDGNEITVGIDYDYYVNSFKVYRGTTKSFRDATEISVTIEAIDELEVDGDTDVATRAFYDLGVFRVYYSATDITARPYPQTYYYWIVTVDQFGNLSDPSRFAQGRRAEDIDYYLPIIDDIDDEDNEYLRETTGSVSNDTRTIDGHTETSLKLEAGVNTRANAGSGYFDASITHEFNFSEQQNSEIVMSFDYKFEDAQKGGFLQAIINGVVVYTAFASEENVTWQNTGLIDISFVAGHNVKLQIGLVCDIDDPTQALWLDRLFVGGQLISPRWELISTPIVDQYLSDFMVDDYDKQSSIYKWDSSVVNEDGSIGEYVGESTDRFKMVASEGYWIFLSQALTKESIDISKTSNYQSPADSVLNNVKTGWSLAGPIKDLYLQDRDAVKNPDENAHYLDEYPGISIFTNVPNGHTADLNDTMPGRALSVMIWEWDAKDNCYRQVFDKLESGKAYWIFKL